MTMSKNLFLGNTDGSKVLCWATLRAQTPSWFSARIPTARWEELSETTIKTFHGKKILLTRIEDIQGSQNFSARGLQSTESLYICVMFKTNSISFCCRFASAQSTLERRLGILDSSMILLQDSALVTGYLGICVINVRPRHRRILPLLQATTMATSIWRWERRNFGPTEQHPVESHVLCA